MVPQASTQFWLPSSFLKLTFQLDILTKDISNIHPKHTPLLDNWVLIFKVNTCKCSVRSELRVLPVALRVACLSGRAGRPVMWFLLLQCKINLQMKKVKNKYNLYGVLFYLNTSLQTTISYFEQAFLMLLLKRKCCDQRTSPNIPPNLETVKHFVLPHCSLWFRWWQEPYLATRNENTFFFGACEWVKLLSSSFGFKPWLWYRRLIWLWFE